MAIVRWDPVRELDSFQTDMNRLFDGFFGARNGASGGGHRRWIPAMDLVETDEHLVLRADLPGLSEDDAMRIAGEELDAARRHRPRSRRE